MSLILNKIVEQKDKITDEAITSGRLDFDFGHGEGVNFIFNAYISYAIHNAMHRHIPRLEDGLKPVHRGIMYELELLEKGQNHPPYKKSAKVASDVSNDFHPHGADSIYEAATRMTESNGSAKIATADGSGNHAFFQKSDPAGAPRYTEIRSSKNARAFFDDIEGAIMVESRADAKMEIPEFLPVKYPYALVGMNQGGTAVGISTNTAIYDVTEVADLIIKYLKTGKLNDILAPDFTTEGYIVQNTKEFKKLMETAKARVKMRGSVEFKGKDIFLYDFPHGVKNATLIKEINDLNLKGVEAYDGTTYGQKVSVRVKCPDKASMQDILNTIYTRTSFQKYINFNNRFIYDNRLVSVGLYDAVKLFIKSRKEVLTRKFNLHLERVRFELSRLEPFVTLLENKQAHMEFMSIYGDINRSEAEAVKFLRDFGIENEDTIEFIMSRTMRALRNGGRYIDNYNGFKLNETDLLHNLDNLDEYLISTMEDMKRDWGHYKRKSKITTEDFVKVDREDIPSEVTICVVDGLVSRMEGHAYLGTAGMKTIGAMTDQTLVVGTSDGSIQTIRVKDIPEGFPSTHGMPVNNVFGQLYDILFLEIAEENKEVYLFYKTGHLSFVDLTPYTRKSNIARLKTKALPDAETYLKNVSEVGIWDDEVASRVVVQSKGYDINWVSWSDVKHKSAKATSRLYVPVPKSTVIMGQPYEFEGAWFMDEYYHRPRLVQRASNATGNGLINLVADISALKRSAVTTEQGDVVADGRKANVFDELDDSDESETP